MGNYSQLKVNCMQQLSASNLHLHHMKKQHSPSYWKARKNYRFAFTIIYKYSYLQNSPLSTFLNGLLNLQQRKIKSFQSCHFF
uniref:Uncharacterized protein n=1 Tax=Anguilla anguilla TaxID=7936 RepID=A0A0E9XGS2_ANGAN